MKPNSPTGPVVSADVSSETAFVADGLNNDTVKAAPELRGVTGRVVIFSLVLAMLFGYCIPVVDYKFSNTFLGAAHLPAAAVVVLLVVLLLLNPLLHSVAGRATGALSLLLVAGGLAAGCWLIYWFNTPISAFLAPQYGIVSWLFVAGALAATFFYAAHKRALLLVLALASGLLAFITHFLVTPEKWASALVLLCYILGISAALFLVACLLRRPLARNEVLTVYITCLFSALVPGRGGENFFIPNILAPFYLSTRENKWLEFLEAYIPHWMTPALSPQGRYLKEIVEPWYSGLSAGQSIPWGAWIVPLIAWCSLILALYCLLGCLGVMLRAQWAEREALAFPLLRLPLEMTEGVDELGQGSASKRESVPAFFRNPLMWIGFGIAVVIEGLNGLNLYYPEVPPVPLTLPAGPLLSEAPWNQIGGMDLRIYPAVVGITYLLTSEVSFSLWFVYIFTKVQLIIAYYIGFQPNSMPPPFWTRGWAEGFIGYQQIGAYFAYVGVLIWLARGHFAHIFRRAIKKEAPTAAEKEEALSYPVAFWGFVAAFAFVVTWTAFAGAGFPVAFLMWITYLVLAMGLTRIVAEGGLMFVHTGWMTLGPLAHLFRGGPGNLINETNAPAASLVSGSIMFEMRGFLLPSFVQSFKLAHDRKIATRPLMGLIAGVTIVSFFISVWTIIRLGYVAGGLTLQPWWARNVFQVGHAQSISKGVDETFATAWGWTGIGAFMTLGIMLARSRFLWFPLHPVGILMCVPFAMFTMWVSIMLGWLIKVVIMRFGGSDSYRKMIPAFLGLALGDMVMVAFWVAIDGWQGRTGHSLLPF